MSGDIGIWGGWIGSGDSAEERAMRKARNAAWPRRSDEAVRDVEMMIAAGVPREEAWRQMQAAWHSEMVY